MFHFLLKHPGNPVGFCLSSSGAFVIEYQLHRTPMHHKRASLWREAYEFIPDNRTNENGGCGNSWIQLRRTERRPIADNHAGIRTPQADRWLYE